MTIKDEKRKIASTLIKEYSLEITLPVNPETIHQDMLKQKYNFLEKNIQFKDESVQRNIAVLVSNIIHHQEELQKQIYSFKRCVRYHEGALNLLEEKIIDTHIETKYKSEIHEKKNREYTFSDWLKIFFLLGKPDGIVVTTEHSLSPHWKEDRTIQEYLNRANYLCTKAKEYARRIVKVDTKITEGYEKIKGYLNMYHFTFKKQTENKVSDILEKHTLPEVQVAKEFISKKAKKDSEKLK